MVGMTCWFYGKSEGEREDGSGELTEIYDEVTARKGVRDLITDTAVCY